MRHVLRVLLATALAATWFGCQVSTESTVTDAAPATDTPAASATADGAAATLVSLNVPNMT